MSKFITPLLITTVVILIIIIMSDQLQPETVTVTVPSPPQVTVIEQSDTTPPYRQYKPKRFQQMGLLTNATETLPLYGRAAPYYRDRNN
jgi:hypothetical protein